MLKFAESLPGGCRQACPPGPQAKRDGFREAMNRDLIAEGIVVIDLIAWSSPRIRTIAARDKDLTTTERERTPGRTFRTTTPSPEKEDEEENLLMPVVASASMGMALFGVCFGCQLLARKLGRASRGADVEPGAPGDDQVRGALPPQAIGGASREADVEPGAPGDDQVDAPPAEATGLAAAAAEEGDNTKPPFPPGPGHKASPQAPAAPATEMPQSGGGAVLVDSVEPVVVGHASNESKRNIVIL